jgi:hypothetical protein
MGSPDDVGAVHQVLDGTMLDLDVSADFLRSGVTMAGVIVDYDVTVDGGYAVDGMTVGTAFTVSDVSFALGYAFTVGAAFAMGNMSVRGGFTVSSIVGVTTASLKSAASRLADACAGSPQFSRPRPRFVLSTMRTRSGPSMSVMPCWRPRAVHRWCRSTASRALGADLAPGVVGVRGHDNRHL